MEHKIAIVAPPEFDAIAFQVEILSRAYGVKVDRISDEQWDAYSGFAVRLFTESYRVVRNREAAGQAEKGVYYLAKGLRMLRTLRN